MSEIPYKLVRSRRRTLALIVNREAQLIVRAPMKMSENVILDFIRKKARWIAEKQRQATDTGAKQKTFTLSNGETVLYQGNTYTILRKPVSDVTLDGHVMHVPDAMTLDGFAAWMREQGRRMLRERADYFADLMGLRYTSIKMSGAKRRWGSCSARNALNFAWRLMMCPPPVIDYVVVHELSHIPHKGHGARFWNHVATVMPDYKEAQQWLRHNRKVLDVV